MKKTPRWKKNFSPRSLPLLLSTCAVLYACKPGGETSDVTILPPVSFGESADLRALLVSETNNCLYVADHNQKQIHCVDLTTHAINNDAALATTANGKPVAMAMSPDKTLLAVATEDATTGSQVEVISFDTKSRKSCGLPVTPNSIAVTSTNEIYVGTGAQNGAIYSCIPVPQGTVASLFDSNYNRIAGMSHDGNTLFTATPDLSSVGVRQLDAVSASAVSAYNLFGTPSTLKPSYGWVMFRPDDRQALVLTNMTESDGNYLPTYSVERKPLNLSKITPPLRPTFIPNALAFLQPLHRAVMTHASTAPNWSTRHNAAQTDLHVFDTDTGDEIAHYDVGDHVRENGLAVDQYNAIYMLLGETQATRVGIVTPP